MQLARFGGFLYIWAEGKLMTVKQQESGMDDKTIQRKLNQLVKIANELHEEAQSRYGSEAQVFYEAEGSFHIMSKDSDGTARERQKGVKHSSDGYCLLGCGAW